MNTHKFCDIHQVSICSCYCEFEECGQCRHSEICTEVGLKSSIDKLIRDSVNITEFDYEEESISSVSICIEKKDDSLGMGRTGAERELAQSEYEREADGCSAETVLSPAN